MKKRTHNKNTNSKNILVFFITIIILISLITTTIGLAIKYTIPHPIYGFAKYYNNEYADGAKVYVNASSIGKQKTTWVGPAGGWETGYWQVDVGDPDIWPNDTPFTVDIIGQGSYHGWKGNTSATLNGYANNMGTVIINPSTTKPDLLCEGSLSWVDVKRGISVNGVFTVRNNGGQGSKLDWKVDSYPDWGAWTFTPSEGSDLTPETGPITVQVSIIAPKAKSIPLFMLDKNKEFSGSVSIINKEDPSDKEIIPVSMIVSKSKTFIFFDIWESILNRFPFIIKTLKQITL